MQLICDKMLDLVFIYECDLVENKKAASQAAFYS